MGRTGGSVEGVLERNTYSEVLTFRPTDEGYFDFVKKFPENLLKPHRWFLHIGKYLVGK